MSTNCNFGIINYKFGIYHKEGQKVKIILLIFTPLYIHKKYVSRVLEIPASQMTTREIVHRMSMRPENDVGETRERRKVDAENQGFFSWA